MLLPGTYMAYMGQELAMERRIGLFDREPISAREGDPTFKPFFAQALALSTRIKAEAPLFDARLLGDGIVLIERSGPGCLYRAVLNLDGRSGRLALPRELKLKGTPLMGDRVQAAGDSIILGRSPLVLRISP